MLSILTTRVMASPRLAEIRWAGKAQAIPAISTTHILLLGITYSNTLETLRPRSVLLIFRKIYIQHMYTVPTGCKRSAVNSRHEYESEQHNDCHRPEAEVQSKISVLLPVICHVSYVLPLTTALTVRYTYPLDQAS